MATNTNISKKRKFVADGLFYAELNEFLQNELGEDGYAGVEVRVTPMRTEIIIRATRTQNVLGEKGRRIRELTSLVAKRFLFPEGNVELYAERSETHTAQRSMRRHKYAKAGENRQRTIKQSLMLICLLCCLPLCVACALCSVQNRALSAIAQAESLRFKLLGGLAVRRACYGVMRYVMENGAKGVEVVISGKLRAARAKAMKFRDGYMIKSGDAVNHYIDFAVRHIQLKQGVLGIKVKIQLPHDPTGKNGVAVKPSDVVTILDPKEDVPVTQPKQQGFVQNVAEQAAPAAQVPQEQQ